MTALFAGLTTVDVLHGLDHTPNPQLKVTSTNFMLAAGGPATNAAVTYAQLDRIARTTPTCPLAPTETTSASHTQTQTTLLTALGTGPLAAVIRSELQKQDVHILDAAQEHTHESPAISSIIDHPEGRMVASTNARVPIDENHALELLTPLNHATHNSPIDIVLIDGHNPELAQLALRLRTNFYPTSDNENTFPHAGDSELEKTNPFAHLEEKPSHLRVLDGGSWKPWLVPLLGLIDIAVISADFIPPLLNADNPQAIAEFLRGFGITRIIRTNGPDPVQWWWGDDSGHVEVPPVNAISTLGAGDIFHGAFAWALTHAQRAAVPALGQGNIAANPEALIKFANRVAAISTTHFGSRKWVTDPEIARIVSDFIGENNA